MTADLDSLYLPTVSVIVPIYNGEQDLPGLLDRLMAQTYPADRVEYLLVDNASIDSTADILISAVEKFASKGLTLKAMSEGKIQSAYAARNTAILAATGDFLAFTDADCYPHPDWLMALMQPFEDEKVGLVAGRIAAFPGKTLLENYAERKKIMHQEDTLAHSFCPYGQTANLGVRLAALKDVGLFRPYLTTGGDADICWRVQKEAGWKIRYATESVIEHRHRQTIKDLYAQWYRYGKSNHYLNQLHGVELTKRSPKQDRSRSLLRWALKELPSAGAKLLLAKGSAVDLAITPLDMYCSKARDLGQLEAQLPEEAKEKAYFPTSATHR
ncbi:MAG: glycosyltransferase [Leptolyngbya foveolarum]|uniref:Glycosyltransferase n=1 Tax=Leptolyngbya foveolarum TaxID=47253 RepID=A0A2W4UG88_9CYAN|nr:MAG: glycosyltransferase [Leptolyngbya foveolarum]